MRKLIFKIPFIVSIGFIAISPVFALTENPLYKKAVHEYLLGNETDTIDYLKKSIETNQNVTNSKKLLRKVLLKQIDSIEDPQQSPKGKILLKDAHRYFPGDKSFPVYVQQESNKNKIRIPIKSISRGSPHPIVKKPKPVIPLKNEDTHDVPKLSDGETDSINYLKFVNLIWIPFLFAAQLILFLLFFSKYRKQTLFQYSSLHKLLQQKEDENKKLANSILIEQEANKRAEQLYKNRLETEKRFKDKNKPNFVPPSLPQPFPSVMKRPIPMKNNKLSELDHKLIITQQKKARETVIQVTPIKNREAWKRIADQSNELYRVSPKAAIEFLRKMAKDDDPRIRMSIIQALCQIGTAQSIDILLELKSDVDPQVHREIIKGLKYSIENPFGRLTEDQINKINSILSYEHESGEWVM